MPVEMKGKQLRIRVASPRKFTTFRTQDVGSPGGLMRVAGYSEKTGYETQSWRVNLDDYDDLAEVSQVISGLDVRPAFKRDAKALARRYFKRKKKVL